MRDDLDDALKLARHILHFGGFGPHAEKVARALLALADRRTAEQERADAAEWLFEEGFSIGARDGILEGKHVGAAKRAGEKGDGT